MVNGVHEIGSVVAAGLADKREIGNNIDEEDSSMSDASPPLHALRAFEAAGRLQSFTRAAAELHVTPAAISHQIRGLEAFLGVRLFRRTTRRILLTEEGQLALAHFRDGFERLARGVEVLRRRGDRGILTVTTTPSFASRWLIPRLDGFAKRHPKVDLRLATNTTLADFARDQVDVGIRFGRGPYEGLAADRLFGESLTPMASPRLLRGSRRPPDPRRLLSLPLLHDDSVQMTGRQPGWAEWFRRSGVEAADTSRGMHFDDGHLALQAAIEGRGVALGRRVLAAADLGHGLLSAPFALALPLSASYWFICPEARRDDATVSAFRTWLLAEAQAFASEVPEAPARRRK
jgi:LysR family glycine cleavage system transcriptional activator